MRTPRKGHDRIRTRLDHLKEKAGASSDSEFARITGIKHSTICDIRAERQIEFGYDDRIKLHDTIGAEPNDITEFLPAEK